MMQKTSQENQKNPKRQDQKNAIRKRRNEKKENGKMTSKQRRLRHQPSRQSNTANQRTNAIYGQTNYLANCLSRPNQVSGSIRREVRTRSHAERVEVEARLRLS